MSDPAWISDDEEIVQHSTDLGDCSGMISNLFGNLMGSIDVPESPQVMNRATSGSAAYELYSAVDVDIMPGETVLVETGIEMKLPAGWWFNIRTKSRHAAWGKTTEDGIMRTWHSVITLAGVIDSDFTGTIKVLLHNLSRDQTFSVRKGDAIAQGILCRVHTFSNENIIQPDNTDHSGFGSTN